MSDGEFVCEQGDVHLPKLWELIRDAEAEIRRLGAELARVRRERDAFGMRVESLAKELRETCIARDRAYEKIGTLLADNGILISRLERMIGVLHGYMDWEANLLLSSEAWDGGRRAYPVLTEELYDRLTFLQTLRNEALEDPAQGKLFDEPKEVP